MSASATQLPKITAIAPWFGGKRTLAPLIGEQLGPHVQYFEPFCGSMAVLFAKEPSRNETVNDLHGDLINLARVIADQNLAPRLYERLQRTVVCEGLLNDAQHWLKHEELGILPAVDWAYHYFLASWMGRNGVSGTDTNDYRMAVRWTPNGGSPTVRFRSAVESLPAWHRRLLNVVILCRDAFGIIPKIPDRSDTAIYVDPPYPSETRSGLRARGNHTSRYLHEFQSGGDDLFDGGDDHARLADLLRGYKHTRVVVSSYDCRRIRKLYAGWKVIECPVNKQLAQQNARGNHKTVAPEILLVNGPRIGIEGSRATRAGS